MTDWERLAGRVVRGIVYGTGALLLLGMVLSYSGLRSFYLGCGLPSWAASASPLCVDMLALVAYVALVTLAGSGAHYAGSVVALTVLGSAAAQGYHLSHGGIAATVGDPWIVAAAGASAMVCAGLAGHLLFLVLRRALPTDFITALAGPPVAIPPAPADADPTDPTPDLATYAAAAARLVEQRSQFAAELEQLRGEFPDPGPVSTGDPKVAAADHPLPGRERLTAVIPPDPAPPIPPPPPPRSRAPRRDPKVPAGRGARGGTSQAPAPCEGCTHHDPAELVSRSARSRCRTDACPRCKETATNV